jgi:hypothetical protein
VNERVAIAGFLAGYTGSTGGSNTSDLRIFALRSTTSPALSGWIATSSVQAGLGSSCDHAPVTWLAMNGLRISEPGVVNPVVGRHARRP